MAIVLDGSGLTVEKLVQIARYNEKICSTEKNLMENNRVYMNVPFLHDLSPSASSFIGFGQQSGYVTHLRLSKFRLTAKLHMSPRKRSLNF